MITADNAPALVPVDALEGQGVPTPLPTLENAAQGQQDKATLTAQLALHGFEVRVISTGGFFVSRWDGTRYCPQLADLQAFAARVGAA